MARYRSSGSVMVLLVSCTVFNVVLQYPLQRGHWTHPHTQGRDSNWAVAQTGCDQDRDPRDDLYHLCHILQAVYHRQSMIIPEPKAQISCTCVYYTVYIHICQCAAAGPIAEKPQPN
jgi:hypothetical protein